MPFTGQTVSVIVGADSWLSRAIEQAQSKRPGKVVTQSGGALDVGDEWAVGSFFGSPGSIDHVVLTGGLATVDTDAALGRPAADLRVVRPARRRVRPNWALGGTRCPHLWVRPWQTSVRILEGRERRAFALHP